MAEITRMPTEQLKRCAEILAQHGKPNAAKVLLAAAKRRSRSSEERAHVCDQCRSLGPQSTCGCEQEETR